MNTTELKNMLDYTYNCCFEWSDIKHVWEMAVYYNKLQNQCLKGKEINEPIKNMQDHDGTWKTIRAKHNYSRKQWAIILAGDLRCLSISHIKSKL